MSKSKSKRKTTMAVSGALSLHQQGRHFLAGNRIELLEAIDRLGSITKAAKAVGLSYKAAWEAAEAMNNMAEKPLLIRATGGQHGGGRRLTDYGRQMAQLYRQLELGQQRVLARMQAELHDVDRLNNLLKAITMKTSARNQLRGKISSVKRGAVNAEVILDLGDDLEIVANITNASVTDLGLKRGGDAMALIKSSFVLLSPDPQVRISARNKLTGTITAIARGAVNGEVKISLAGDRTLVAIVTMESLKELGLRKGSACTALIKASHVLIAVN